MADTGNTSRTPAEIRSEIDATRQQMGDAISALEERLDPERLKQQASSTIRDQTVGRVERFADNATENVKGIGNDVFKTIKDNPLPAAIAAIGLGWLLMERRSEDQGSYRGMSGSRRPQRYDPYDYRYARGGDAYTRGEDVMAGQRGYRMADTGREAPADWQDRAENVKDQVQAKAHEATDRFRQAGSDVQDKAQEVVGQAQERFQDLADTAQEQAGRARSRLEDMMDENPLLVGAAAVALGAAIGLSLPPTAKEDKLLGRAHDDLMDRAQSTIGDTAQKAQEVVKQAGDAAKQAAKVEAKKQNLTTGG